MALLTGFPDLRWYEGDAPAGPLGAQAPTRAALADTTLVGINVPIRTVLLTGLTNRRGFDEALDGVIALIDPDDGHAGSSDLTRQTVVAVSRSAPLNAKSHRFFAAPNPSPSPACPYTTTAPAQCLKTQGQ